VIRYTRHSSRTRIRIPFSRDQGEGCCRLSVRSLRAVATEPRRLIKRRAPRAQWGHDAMVGAGSQRWRCLLGMGVSLVGCGAVAWADQTSAMRLYAAKKYGEAFQQFLPLAEGGNPVAQFFMAVMLDNGQSVPVDHATAAGWYRRAAEQGHADAQLRL